MTIQSEALDFTDAVPAIAAPATRTVNNPRPVRTEPAVVRWSIIVIAVGFLSLFIVLPLITVFEQAFSKGWDLYVAAITDPDARHAIYLTLIAAAIAVVTNLVFGLVMAWSVAKFEFRGKSFLIT